VTEKTDSLYVKLLRSVFKFGTLHNIQTVVSDAARALGTAIILWVGARSILAGEMSIGQLVAFNTLLVYFLDPVRNLMNLQPTIQSAIVAARRLSDVLVLEAETLSEDDQVDLKRVDQPVIFDDVTFRYGTRRPVLQNLTLAIPPGASVALVGESGSGKTTTAKLLLKFYEAESGTIRFGDLAVADISAESLRQRIAYVSQKTSFFAGSIEENLRVAKPDMTPEEMIEACRQSQAHEFIEKLPARYQTYLDEDGMNLSGGQRQRLAIARALLRGADMLILDEATSNLDSISEKAIADTITAMDDGRITRLVIAHRLSTVVACDLIYVMSAGQIVEAGSHADLMRLNGQYAALWRAQTGGSDAPALTKNGGPARPPLEHGPVKNQHQDRRPRAIRPQRANSRPPEARARSGTANRPQSPVGEPVQTPGDPVFAGVAADRICGAGTQTRRAAKTPGVPA
jgi:ATP-binding cassette subfamily B protein